MIRAYEEQVAAIEALGGRIILMAGRALARVRQVSRTTTTRSMTASSAR